MLRHGWCLLIVYGEISRYIYKDSGMDHDWGFICFPFVYNIALLIFLHHI